MADDAGQPKQAVVRMVRGKFVVRDVELVGKLGAGDYVPREKSELAKPRR